MSSLSNSKIAWRSSRSAQRAQTYTHGRKPSDREIRRLVVGDTIAEIYHRSAGVYGILRVRATSRASVGG